MKYRENVKGKQPRGSKNNLTKGAFGLCHNLFEFKLKKLISDKPVVPQMKKGKIESTYTPYKVKKNKYTPNSKGKVKKNV